MDAQILEYIERYPELDEACTRLVLLSVEARARDGRGETGVRVLHKGKDKPMRKREVVDVVYE